jgi:hypothetical protein
LQLRKLTSKRQSRDNFQAAESCDNFQAAESCDNSLSEAVTPNLSEAKINYLIAKRFHKAKRLKEL